MSVTIHQGDILTSTTEAIVNPANSFLNHGGGLAAIIDKAATGSGIRLDDPDRARLVKLRDVYSRDKVYAPLIATGNVHVGPPGLLADSGFKAILHVVGPIWNGGGFFETDLLGACVDSIGRVARANDIDSVAIPAISCGIFGFPVETAARVLLGAAEFMEDDYGVRSEFWLFEDEHVEAFRRQDADALFGAR